MPLATRGDANGKRKTDEVSCLWRFKLAIPRLQILCRWPESPRPAMQGLRPEISCQSKMKPVSTRALAPKATQALLKSKHPHDKQDIKDLITTLRSQLSHVKAQTAFLDLKRTEMRSDDQVSLYGFMDAQEQLKIEKSLLAGHARMLRDMIAEMKLKPAMETRRLLTEIRNVA